MSVGVLQAPKVKRSRTVGTQTPGSWLQTQNTAAAAAAAAAAATTPTQNEVLNQPAFPGKFRAFEPYIKLSTHYIFMQTLNFFG